MQRFTAQSSRKIVGFLLTAFILSSGFFYAPQANALENRYGTVLGDKTTDLLANIQSSSSVDYRFVILAVENVTDLLVVTKNGDIVNADDQSTFTDEFSFVSLEGGNWLGVFGTTDSYKIRFTTMSAKLNLSLYSGPFGFNASDTVTDTSLQYFDFSLSDETPAQIEVTQSAVSRMKADKDSNGTYETTPTPSYSKIGSTVKDTEPPVLSYDQSGNGLNVTATDATGVKNIYYSTTERTGRLVGNAKKYTGTISLSDFSQGDFLYFMAEDPVGNRGFWESYMIIETEPTPTPTPTGNPTPTPFVTYIHANIKCGTDTVYYVNTSGEREAYPSAEIYFLWNSSFDQIINVDISTCELYPYLGLTEVPVHTFIKVNGDKTVYRTDGRVAYPIASYDALLRMDPNPRIITVPLEYLQTYSRGGLLS